ncbi:hypothetical protein QAD02_009995 [Eretmocerus hayati]|uniref:Uncharacterized protein n=1 Tax=Eretmocerus hayati TaxID=131215 RepID=A0ACC2NB71_9HYME|nr:hypothetical protein QAD02_009995 [Eretmocerus hayati]
MELTVTNGLIDATNDTKLVPNQHQQQQTGSGEAQKSGQKSDEQGVAETSNAANNLPKENEKIPKGKMKKDPHQEGASAPQGDPVPLRRSARIAAKKASAKK